MIISIRELFRNRDDARDPTWHGGITNQLFPYSIPRYWIWRFTLRGSNSNIQAPPLALTEIPFFLVTD